MRERPLAHDPWKLLQQLLEAGPAGSCPAPSAQGPLGAHAAPADPPPRSHLRAAVTGSAGPLY